MAEPKQKDLADLLTGMEDRVRGLEQFNVFSWDNIRVGAAVVAFSGGFGTMPISPPFPSQCIIGSAQAHHVGPPGGFTWVINTTSHDQNALFLVAYQIDPSNPVGMYTGNVTVGYIAVGF